ncbi:MAG: MarR family transcriptional regulator [candidate division Zixibacteria bacterium]|nr:MarR family transcriptional regulator [candidate division Zixibacteria bacterium]
MIKTPASRSSDPHTSHEAEEFINKTGIRESQQMEVLAWLKLLPGHTSRELAMISGIDRYIVARRLPELAPMHAEKGEARKCNDSGRQAITWYPVGD